MRTKTNILIGSAIAAALALGLSAPAFAGEPEPEGGYSMPQFDKFVGFTILNRGKVAGQAVAASEAEGDETDTFAAVRKVDSFVAWGSGSIKTGACTDDPDCDDTQVEAGSATNLLLQGESGAVATGEKSSYAGTADMLEGFTHQSTSVGFYSGTE